MFAVPDTHKGERGRCWRGLVLGRGRRGKARYCLVESSLDSRDVCLRCDRLPMHIHVSHGEVFGNVAPGAVPKPLREDFLGHGGMLEHRDAEWVVVGSVLRLRRSEVVSWLRLDALIKRGDEQGWATTYLADRRDASNFRRSNKTHRLQCPDGRRNHSLARVLVSHPVRAVPLRCSCGRVPRVGFAHCDACLEQGEPKKGKKGRGREDSFCQR